VEIITDVGSPRWPGERSVITIGVYDGVHRGHRAVIAEVRRLAAEHGARSAVVTFSPHPASVVRPESAPRLLTDDDQRLELLAETGVDAAVLLRFDDDLRSEDPEAFVERVLAGCLGASVVVVG
jgi:riboflavin kinase/FMN adenylyltransferase